jgi:CRP/FNR family transcriptional regulator, cyclic AMP receptor protein
MAFSFDLGILLGATASTLTLVSFSMKSMLPLRAFALASNLFFIAYGYVDLLWPVLVLHACLLPLNAKRLLEIRKLTADIRRSTENSPVVQWLLPQMNRRLFKAGEVLFRKGDTADSMFYVANGELRMEGVDQRLGPGELIGEIGLFSPDRKRTQTITCHTDAVLYGMTDEMLYRLYYQNPKLGFYFMHLIIARLQRDITSERLARAAG